MPQASDRARRRPLRGCRRCLAREEALPISATASHGLVGGAIDDDHDVVGTGRFELGRQQAGTRRDRLVGGGAHLQRRAPDPVLDSAVWAMRISATESL